MDEVRNSSQADKKHFSLAAANGAVNEERTRGIGYSM